MLHADFLQLVLSTTFGPGRAVAGPLNMRMQINALRHAGSPTLGGHGLFAPNRDASSLLRFPLSKLKLDNLFLLWLAIPDSQKLVRYPQSLHRCINQSDHHALRFPCNHHALIAACMNVRLTSTSHQGEHTSKLGCT